MAEKSILQCLPKDTVIDFAGMMDKPPRIHIRMTLLNAGHVEALKLAIDKTILPLFRMFPPCSPETNSLSTSQTTTVPATEEATATTAQTEAGISTAVSVPDGEAGVANIGIPSNPEPGTN